MFVSYCNIALVNEEYVNCAAIHLRLTNFMCFNTKKKKFSQSFVINVTWKKGCLKVI